MEINVCVDDDNYGAKHLKMIGMVQNALRETNYLEKMAKILNEIYLTSIVVVLIFLLPQTNV